MANVVAKAVTAAAVFVVLALATGSYAEARTTGNFAFKRAGLMLDDCMDESDMIRTLRSENLNHYLFGLAKCVASAGRPRFGKRSEYAVPPSSRPSPSWPRPRWGPWPQTAFPLSELAAAYRHRMVADAADADDEEQ